MVATAAEDRRVVSDAVQACVRGHVEGPLEGPRLAHRSNQLRFQWGRLGFPGPDLCDLAQSNFHSCGVFGWKHDSELMKNSRSPAPVRWNCAATNWALASMAFIVAVRRSFGL